MKAFLEVHPDIETHLCLSATTRDRELAQTVGRFSELPVSRLLFTKLDESMSYGCIVNTHLRHKLPLSYFTTGQKVPEDIETASPKRVADLVVREMKP
jgi:flagellar biosynthesis protein FlhF